MGIAAVRMHCRQTLWPLALFALLLAAVTAARAQDIEPRAYSNAPVGVNFLGFGYAYTQGSLPTNPSLPLTNSHLTTSSALLGYGHVFDLWSQSAKVNVVAPYSWLSGNAVFAGQPIQRSVIDPARVLLADAQGGPCGLHEAYRHAAFDASRSGGASASGGRVT